MQSPSVPGNGGPGGPGTGGIPPAQPHKRNRALATVMTLLVLVILIGGIILVSQLAGGDSGSADVPNVVGMKFEDAKSELADAGFDDVQREDVTNETIAVDVVFEMDPGAGDHVDKSTTIKLTVSAGQGDVVVPDVRDQNANDAEAFLKASGFKVERVPEASDTVDADKVIRTEPAGDQKAAAGSTVRIFVSSGKEQVDIPNVDGIDSDQAAVTLQDADFQVTEVSEANDTVPSGTVIRTEPAGGTKAPRGSRVRMITSSGIAQVTVPELRGQTQADAEAQLQNLGLKSSVVTRQDTAENAGRVVDQSVTPTERVPPGTTILLTVGSSAATTTTTVATTPSSTP
jgi:serine/threonine-protein kinase